VSDRPGPRHPGLGPGRGDDEGRWQAHADHPAAARLRRARRWRRHPAERDADVRRRAAQREVGRPTGAIMSKAFLVVRAIVPEPAQRKAFDDWYRCEHLPQAMKAFRAEKGWRFWSDTDPSAHQATYQVADRAAAEAALNSAGMKQLIAEFDRAW